MYVATKEQKVKAADVDPSHLPPNANPDSYVIVHPGTQLPGAARWPNVGSYIRQGYVQFAADDQEPDPSVPIAILIPPRQERHKPTPARPRPSVTPSDSSIPESWPPTKSTIVATESEPATTNIPKALSESELSRMNKAQLADLGESLDLELDPQDLKADLIAAILEAQG
jgi:hypothetical protein